MPEFFDPDIPVSRRRKKGTGFHRNFKRTVYPPYISKDYVRNESYRFTDSYIKGSWNYNPGFAKDQGPFPAVEKADSFGIHSYFVKYSVNKKYRWDVVEELASGIFNYQDDVCNLRTSFIRSTRRDYRMRKEYGYRIAPVRTDVEYCTVKDGEEVHKYASRANKDDLFKKPNPPRKGRKTRNQDSYEDYSVLDKKVLHVKYKARTIQFDRRAENRVDPELEKAKRKAHFGHRRRNSPQKVEKSDYWGMDAHTCELRFGSAKDEDQIGCSPSASHADELQQLDWEQEPHDLCTYDSTFNKNFFNLADFCSQKVICDENASNSTTEFCDDNDSGFTEISASCIKHRSRRKSRKNWKTSGDPTYLRWLQTSPLPLNVFEVEVGGSENSEADDQTLAPEVTTASITCIMPLKWHGVTIPARETIEDYIQKSHPKATLIFGISPKTYFLHVDDTFDEDIGTMRGYCILQADRTCSDRPSKLRLTTQFCDADNEGLKFEDDVSKCPGTVEHLYPSHLLPSKVISPAVTFGEKCCKLKYLDQWTSSLSKDLAADAGQQNDFCEVCYSEDGSGFSLQCGHHFCDECWLGTAAEALRTGSVPIKCMGVDCGIVVGLRQALTFLPYEYYLKYEKLLFDKMLMSKHWMYCDCCNRIIHAEAAGKSALVAHCECGFVKCLRCKNPAHHPMPCGLAEKYRSALESNGVKIYGASDQAGMKLRRCPACRACCERIDGCNHMWCPCGFEFCYACGAEFDHEHYDCEKIVLQRINLFEVHGAPVEELLQKIFEENFVYRQMRSTEEVEALKSKLQAIGPTTESFANIYLSALVMLELGKTTALYLHNKWKWQNNGIKRRRRRRTRKNKRVKSKALVSWNLAGVSEKTPGLRRFALNIDALRFIVDRFAAALADKKPKLSVIQRLGSIMESKMRFILMFR